MPQSQPVVLCAIFSLLTGAFAENLPVVLYMGGDYSSLEYHLGVLSEIERLQIPVDTVVGTQWGAFAGSLWSAGRSAGQIRELLKSWDSLPRPKQSQNPALLKVAWLVRHREDGSFFLEEITESKPYFGQLFFDLRVQESLLNSTPGLRIPFREINGTDNYPFPPPGHENIHALLSTPLALRDTNGTAEQRYQQKLWNGDSTLIVLRPHSKPNPDSLFEAGIQAVQNRRSVFSQLPALNYQSSAVHQREPNSEVFQLSTPVFNSTPSELQGHLKSFWEPDGTGLPGIKNFLEDLQRDASYRELNITADSNNSLQINTDNNPQLSFSLFGFGGTLWGANIAANANFRFVNQFGWNLDLTAFYGQGVKGAEPKLRMERIFMGNGDLFAKGKFFKYEPAPFFQKSVDEKARVLKENSRSVTLGVEKPLGRNKSVLQVAAEIEHREVVSGAAKFPIYEYDEVEDKDTIAGFYHESVAVNSIFPYLKWFWQSDGYDRWFARDGFMAELSGGLKAVSVISVDQNVPFYVSSQGKTGITHPLSKYISVSGGSEFGANFRIVDGKAALPEELQGAEGIADPALENRYRFAVGMGSYREGWQTPVNSSHCYGIVFAGLSLQWQGSGVFLTGGYGTENFFAEPKIRIKTQTFDLVMGQSMAYSTKNRIFLSIRGGGF